MGVIEGGMELFNAGAPAAGTAAVQTLTIGGTPTGGTFRLKHGPFVSAAITWTAVDATLVSAIDAALEALASIGAAGVVAADSTLTSGIGDVTLTFAAKAPQTLIEAISALTGTAPTVVVAETTPGIKPTGLGSPRGATLSDTTNGVLYINTGSATAPTWTKVGTQT